MAFKIKNRSQLIYALTEIAELEHTLMCQYLFAAASLKASVAELENKDRGFHQIELIRDWKRSLLLVAREEMQHLTYAINLLVSIGGTPTFMRPNFPNQQFYKTQQRPQGAFMSLERFSLEIVERFIQFEAPPPQKFAEFVPPPNYYDTLHEFYTAVKNAFTDDLFVDYGDQYDPKDEEGVSIRLAYRRPINNLVKNAEEARKLINLIMEEGEGSAGDKGMAHVNIFKRIHEAFKKERDADPHFDPARPVLANSLTRIHDDLEENLKQYVNVIPEDLSGGLPYNLLQLFNDAYEILLTWLFQVFDRHGTEHELRAIETLAFMPYMSEVIRPLMELLTQVPIAKDNPATLGASFEVTSNNFLIPKPEITHKITIERLQDMIKLSDEIEAQMRAADDSRIQARLPDFGFIKQSICILKAEFEHRVLYGWPSTDADTSMSEEVSNDFVRAWALRGPSVLELQFEGWFQVRLGSDPDGANEKRGVSGNNFALGDEPDFDRIIHFQPAGAVVRSHCPSIGVAVTKAQLIAAPIDLNNVIIQVPEFEGARVNLLNNPKFEGRNHIVSLDGEPIDPFEIEIKTKDGIRLSRAVMESGHLNGMSSAQRAGSGRYVLDAGVSTAAAKEFLARIGTYKSPQEYLENRIALLETDLKNIPGNQQTGCAAEKLKFRLQCLYEARQSSQGMPVRGAVRWTRFFFFTNYLHTISGPQQVDIGSVDLKFKLRTANERDPNSKWLIEYHLGFFDSDALSGYAYGTLKIPVELP